MNIIHKDIQSNPGLSGKRMTENQLMLLLELVAQYDFNLPDMSGWTVKQASKAIDTILWYKEHGKLKARKRPYSVKDVLNRFIRKHPELYDAIVLKNR